MVYMSMDPHGSSILVLPGERNLGVFERISGDCIGIATWNFFRSSFDVWLLAWCFGLNSMQVGRHSMVWWRN